MEEMVLSYGEVAPEGSPSSVAANALMDYVEDQTDGKITFDRYFASTLVPGAEAMSAAGSGVGDILTIGAPTYHPDELPVANWVVGFGAMEKDPGTIGVVQDNLAVYELYTERDELRDELAQYNVYPLSAVASGGWAHICTTEVATTDDIPGTRTSASGGAWQAEADALGFVTQYVIGSELYETMQRGILDCVINPVASIKDYSPYDVAPHVTMVHYSSMAGGLIPAMNLDLWNSLPSDVQQIFTDAGLVYLEEYIAAALASYEEVITEGEAQGLIFHDPSEINEQLRAYQDEALAEMQDTAPDGASGELMDAYQEALGRWGEALVEAGVEPASSAAESLAKSSTQPWRDVFVQG